MNIKTKSVYDPIGEDDGVRIKVTRYWIRGIGRLQHKIDLWMKQLAPSKELLFDWKKGRITWQEYEERFFNEMKEQKEALDKVREMAFEQTVTFLCVERGAPEDKIRCHRRLLKEIIFSMD